MGNFLLRKYNAAQLPLTRGLLYGANGEKYHITFSKKPSGKKYRYYIPKADQRYGSGTSATGLIPADQIV